MKSCNGLYSGRCRSRREITVQPIDMTVRADSQMKRPCTRTAGRISLIEYENVEPHIGREGRHVRCLDFLIVRLFYFSKFRPSLYDEESRQKRNDEKIVDD